jgi:hypothetical protein
MSTSPLARSADLRRLHDEGYEIRLQNGHLIVDHVPYVTENRTVAYGTLACKLDLQNDVTQRPDTHVIHFVGEYPCDSNGLPLNPLRYTTSPVDLGNGLVAQHSFSNKPPGGYADYHHKITSYVRVVGDPAQAIDPAATATTFPVHENADADSPFEFEDTATSRSGTVAASERLKGLKIGIVGVGGTGSYILDFVAKTPVAEIHLFDDDLFHQHNAFRSPGATTREQLASHATKAEHFATQYSAMHHGIRAQVQRLDAATVSELGPMDFVFLTIDDPAAKRPIMDFLESAGIPFIDCGMGLELTDAAEVTGLVRTTTSTPSHRTHTATRVAIAEPAVPDEYRTNIQIADLNALNAALAVIKWKKLYHYYADLDGEHNAIYIVNGNRLLNEDTA